MTAPSMHRATTTLWASTLTLALVIAVASPTAAQPRPAGQIVANGGTTSSGTGRTLYSTVGQPVVGVTGNPTTRLGHGFWCFGGTRVLDVEISPDADRLPTELAIGRPFPNPSRDAVRFALALPDPARVRLAVYDASGRRVGDAMEMRLDAGVHELRWRAPRRVAGVLFARLLVDDRYEGERRFVLVR